MIASSAVNDMLLAWFPDWDEDKRLQFRAELSSRIETRAEQEAQRKLAQAKEPSDLLNRIVIAERSRDRVVARLHQLAAENVAFRTQADAWRNMAGQQRAMLAEIDRILQMNADNEVHSTTACGMIFSLLKHRDRNVLPPLPEATSPEVDDERATVQLVGEAPAPLREAPMVAPGAPGGER